MLQFTHVKANQRLIQVPPGRFTSESNHNHDLTDMQYNVSIGPMTRFSSPYKEAAPCLEERHIFNRDSTQVILDSLK